jgi:hypothetical protein
MEVSSSASQNTGTKALVLSVLSYRAHPDYHGDGPWYDWAMVKFENFGDYPA